jgi:hypothetical protein
MSESPDPAAPEPVPSEIEGGEPPATSEPLSSGEAEPPSSGEGDPEPPGADALDETPFDFAPVLLRYRYDGWLPEKQLEFIERLADCGCVDEAVKAVGMSRNAAYALRRRPEAQAFRFAWDAAMDAAVARLNDAAMSRAINGVPVPIFQGGEQVGERRHFDERLTMFLLRYRDPARYGKWLDRMDARQHPDGPVMILIYRIARMLRAAGAAFDAAWRGEPAPPPQFERVSTAPQVDRS